jgi:hypothetical protein
MMFRLIRFAVTNKKLYIKQSDKTLLPKKKNFYLFIYFIMNADQNSSPAKKTDSCPFILSDNGPKEILTEKLNIR